jgi:DNA-binding IclR family transcriptional regulator
VQKLGKGSTGVIGKAFHVLRAFTDIQPRWGVRDLAQHLKIPTSTLHRILLNLAEEGLLQFNSITSKYEVGIELIRISSAISARTDIRKIARKFMEELVEEFKETICLVLYNPMQKKIAFVDLIRGPHPLQYVINLGILEPVPYGSSGKSIMAFLTQEEIEEIMEMENIAGDKRGILEKDLSKIREDGFSATEGERIEGSKGISAPIFNADGRPFGSLIYSVPINRDNQREDEIVKAIKRNALEISRILGYIGREAEHGVS